MPAARPLPEELRHGAFTLSESRRLGVTGQRLRASDVVRLGHGLYAEAAGASGWPAGFHPPGHGFGLDALAALTRQYPDAVLSHGTAAQVYRLPVPAALVEDRQVHLTWPPASTRAQARHVRSHSVRMHPEDRTRFRRLPITTPARTWLDLAADPRLSPTDLVVVADAVVNRPWVAGRRLDGLDTLAGLAACVDRAGPSRGIPRARTALAAARVGADSPPETRARLALVDAGLPEPELQVTADPAALRSPTADLGYRRWKIAIQYDGGHHRSPRQQAADAERDAWFQLHGWLVIRLTWRDQQAGFARLASLVRARMAADVV